MEVVSERSPGDWNAARQCLALAEPSRSSVLSKSVRSSASSRSRSICGTSFTNAGLRVTESITAHKSRPGNFSIVYRIVELNLRNRILASSGRCLLHFQERTFTGGVSTSVSCHYRTHALQHSGVTRSPHRRFRAKTATLFMWGQMNSTLITRPSRHETLQRLPWSAREILS
jgi:hypothetical protein